MLLFLKLSSINLKFSLYWLPFACVFTIGSGYNLNTDNRRVFTDPNIENTRASYFGFSTALYVKTNNEGLREVSVIVGAPRANASAIPSVFEPGTVFNCEINDEGNDTCVEWNLDPIGNDEFNILGYKIHQFKNNAWTGGTIGVDYSQTEFPKVVVCAPNWKENTQPTSWPMLGICYWSTGEAGNTFEKPVDGKVIPMLHTKAAPCDKKFSRQYSQAGFSMQLYSERNQSRLLLGCPSAANGKGVPILIEGSDDPIIPTCIVKHRFIKNFDHFGYSVTSGIYHNDGRRWQAASAPSPGDLMGKVVIFVHLKDTGQLSVPDNYKLQGTQMGEYFGASLASCDINNDQKDEIIVGAPFWSDDIDEGRIYVFSETDRIFTKIQVIDGTKSGARFGSAVTCLGDLDKDGYQDIAVGAPYEGNHGAVYIYNGNKQGLNEKFSQRIYGKDISTGIRGFGAAISEPQDVDGNHYADIAIGAYKSGHVVFLRSQPVVIIKMHFSKMENLQSNITVFTVNICSTYEGFRIPETLEVETSFKVDPLRASYGQNSYADGVYKLTSIVNTTKIECIPYDMTLVKSNLTDPIEISASLALVRSSSEKFCAVCPVVDEQKSKLTDLLALEFTPYCGRDNKCVSIIEIAIVAVPGDLENGERYTLGSKPHVGLQVQVSNYGEEAFNAKLHFFIPTPIFPVSILRGCEDKKNNNSWEIICTLGNLFGNNSVIKTFELDMSDVHSDTEYIELFANVSTQSDIASTESNFCKFTIYFDVDVNMAITGKSLPDVQSFDNKDEEQEQKSMTSQHIYTVQKFGKSSIKESSVTIWVPTHLRGKNIEIARIIENSGVIDEQPINCRISSRNEKNGSLESIDEMGFPNQSMSLYSDSLIAENLLKTVDNRSVQESIAAENSNLYVPPANRTFYLNCTNPEIECVQISCKLNAFAVSNTVAKITITLDVQLKNLIPVIMKTKDIIYLVSNASVSGITKSGGARKRIETEFNSTSIGTTFIGSPNALPVATWIIVVSVLFGVLLLVLLTLGLIKLGFFNRRKREELEALKAESDNNSGFVLETSSSREVLDAI